MTSDEFQFHYRALAAAGDPHASNIIKGLELLKQEHKLDKIHFSIASHQGVVLIETDAVEPLKPYETPLDQTMKQLQWQPFTKERRRHHMHGKAWAYTYQGKLPHEF